MTVATALRRTGAVATVDPLTVISWHAAYWASDPAWSNPGDGNAVSSWRDGSGNTRDAAQGTGSRQPVFRSSVSALNNQSAVQFFAVDADWLVSPSFTNPGSTWTAIVVGNVTASPANIQNILAGAGGTIAYSASNVYPGVYNGSTLARPSGGTGAYALRGYANGASSAISANGSTTTGNAGSGTWGTNHYLGAYNVVGGDALRGHIAFAAFYVGDVTAAAGWSSFVSWVATTYGLTIS